MSDSLYSLAFEMDDNFNQVVDMASPDFIKKAIDNPKGKEAKQWAHLASTLIGDSEYSKEAKAIFDQLRPKYDAVPDLHDIASGTSETALIIINPKKVKMVSSTAIGKNMSKEAKQFVKTLEKLPVTELEELFA